MNDLTLNEPTPDVTVFDVGDYRLIWIESRLICLIRKEATIHRPVGEYGRLFQASVIKLDGDKKVTECNSLKAFMKAIGDVPLPIATVIIDAVNDCQAKS